MSKVFTHGKVTVEVLDVNPVINSLKDIPNVVVVLEDKDGDFSEYGLRVSVTGATHLELRDTLSGPALSQELSKFLKAEFGLSVANYFPPFNSMTYALTYPDLRMGDVSACQQKQFAKMHLNQNAVVRMHRKHRNQELVGNIGIFGRWTCGEETGVFSITGSGPKASGLTLGNRKEVESELQYEFAARWPLYPPAVFEIMSYEEIEPLLNKTPLTGRR